MKNLNRGRKAALACVAAASVVVMLVTTPWAHAMAGSTSDNDDVNAVFDVKTLSHDDVGIINDSNSRVIYTVNTWDFFSNTDHYDAKWHLYHTSNGQPFGVVHITRTEGQNNTTSANVEDLNGVSHGAVDVSYPDQKTIRATFTTKALSDVGLGGETSYKYWFEITSNGGTDNVPDSMQPTIQHVLNNAAATTTTSTTAPGGGGSSTTATTTATTVPGGGGGGGSSSSSSSTTATTAGSTVSGSQATGCGDQTLTANPTQVSRGGSTTLFGRCFPSNTDITISMASTPVTLTTIRSDNAGSFAVTVVIPTSTSNGTHTISASGGGRAASVLISVGLAFTGGGHGNWAPLAAALIFAGLVLLAGKLLADQHDRDVEAL